MLNTNEYFLIYCDKKDIENHASFGLNANGESLYLSDQYGNIIDEIEFPEQYSDISYGRNPSHIETWKYCAKPTPGMINVVSQGNSQSPLPIFSHDAGRINSNISLNLTGNNIVYTTDGSEPGSQSDHYSTPININQTTTVKAKTNATGYLPGKTNANTYFYNEHPFTLPVVSLSFEPVFFYDNEIGIYVTGTNGTTGKCGDLANWNQPWERAAYFEYFDENGIKQISQQIGVKVAGGCTRGRDQKSLSFYARGKYDNNDFDYPFFEQKPGIIRYKSLVLRNSGNDQDQTLLRDAFIQALVSKSIDLDYLSYQPTTVFFNGEYRGIMNIREKADEDYFQSNYNLGSDEIDFLEYSLESEIITIRGSNEDYNSIISFITLNNLTDSSNYEWIASHIYIQEYINYMATEIYIGNRDWPQNNIKFWKEKDQGKWRWILFDTDYGLGFRMSAPNDPTFDKMFSDNNGRLWSTILFHKLMENEGFRNRFFNTFITLMHTSFQPGWFNYVLDSLAHEIESEISYNQAKYGRSKSDWEYYIDILRQQSTDRYNFMVDYFTSYFNFIPKDQVVINIDNEHISDGKVILNGNTIRRYPVSVATYNDMALSIRAQPEKGFNFSHWEETDYSIIKTLLATDENWKYLDEATNYLTNWTDISFNDSLWNLGTAELGYGDNDESTLISYGPDANNKIPTALFRKSFEVPDTKDISEVTLGINADDGAIIYFNGIEVYRTNMPQGAVNFNDYADGTIQGENAFVYTTVNDSLLLQGINVIGCAI